jgi:two-component system cell cycle response regulator
LVDDSAEQRDLYALMLEPTATVITASRGEDALAIAGAEPLNAIVLDVLMPGMDGWEVCRRLKASPVTRQIPVIMLTALDGVDVTATAHRAGAVTVLMKPCPVERLALAIEDALQRQADNAHQRASGTTVPGVASDQRHQVTPAHVLIVEDDTVTRLGLQQLLRERGYEALTASTYPDGLRLLEAEPPDLLIADVRLGEFNGLQFVATSQRPIPTIILSDFSGSGFEADARRLGAEYLPKPIPPAALLELIERLLAAAAPRAPIRRWTRKPVPAAVVARVDHFPAHLLNVSYGGLCFEIEQAPSGIPPSFDVTFQTSAVSIHADAVWVSRGHHQSWRCGAAVSHVNDDWRGLVDGMS